MKKLKKIISLLLTVSMLFGAFNVPVYAVEIENEGSSGESTEEPSGFDENAHGEVTKEGNCGDNTKYKLYSDGALYVFGDGEINKNYVFQSKDIITAYICKGITGIGNHTFENCENLQSVFLPDGIKNIGVQAFRKCISLKNINLPDSVEKIGMNAFSECESVENINIPENITEISDQIFSGCSKLKEIQIPLSITKIGNHAFSYSGISEIEIPKNVKEIGNYAFCMCDELKLIDMTDGITEINNNTFWGCSSLESVSLPNSIKTIGKEAFLGCEKLNSIQIPDSVISIDKSAFSSCFKLKIKCNSGTVAEQYAKDNNIKFELLDHTHKYESSITKEPTCTEKGIRTYACSCGDEYTEEVLAKGHEVVIDHAIAPTETEEGRTEGSHCGVCGEILKVQEFIPANGKSELPINNTFNGCKESPIKLSISCNKNDEFKFECKDEFEYKYIGLVYTISGLYVGYKKEYSITFQNVGEHIISVYKNGNLMESDKIIIAENHVWDSGKIEKKSTCTENGRIKYTCTNCKNTRIEFIPANGHKNGDWKIVKNPTNFKEGKEKISCIICGKTLQERPIKIKNPKVIISAKKLKLNVGDRFHLVVTKCGISDDLVKWTTSNKKIVTVGKRTGKIKAKKKGKAKITVKMKSGCKATCKVTVK